MSRSTRLSAATAALTGCLALAVAMPAGAGTAQRIPIDDSKSFEFPLCGIPTDVEIEETGWLMLVEQGRAGDVYSRAHLHGEVVNTNVATGVSVRLVRDAVENDVRIVRGVGDLITITAKSPSANVTTTPTGRWPSSRPGW